ncbi:MAG: PfaD family polyunsaturated fatty acid/polyketide biosynthesis protein [Desulfobacterales bacterium]
MPANAAAADLTARFRPVGAEPEPLEAGALGRLLLETTRPLFVVRRGERLFIACSGAVTLAPASEGGSEGLPLVAWIPPLHPASLGDPAFRAAYGLRYAYVVGEMANAITSVRMVQEAGGAGMIGFFGAGGLPPAEVEEAIDALQRTHPRIPFGVNLIHSPGNPELEYRLAEIFLARGVTVASASAFVEPTPALSLFRLRGIHRRPDGSVVCPNRLIAKVSRVEVARRFLAPPPARHLELLVRRGALGPQEAELAVHVPLAEDLTAEADSGGHTDNRPAIALFPTILALRDDCRREHGYAHLPRVGLAGGIATPLSAAAAFAMGAAFVLAGSVHQGCVEAGTSEAVCRLLAEAGQADVAMAPSADMFELGVKVQVLKRGTMFPQRAARLYELFTAHERWEEIPERQRAILEKDFFRRSFEEEWEATRVFFRERDPRQIESAERNPRHKMALVFRSYLGRSSHWAIEGEPSRRMDYQIWCGPAMGAFNQWAKGSFLEDPAERRTVTVAANLLFGAAVAVRTSWLRSQGVLVPPEAAALRPLRLDRIEALLGPGSFTPAGTPGELPSGGGSVKG